MIPFVLCIVPVPDRVSSPKSLSSQMSGKGMGYGDGNTGLYQTRYIFPRVNMSQTTGKCRLF